MSELDIELYLPAGVATSPLFMERLRQVIKQGLEDTGAIVRSSLAFPYGDKERPLVGQLREVVRDLRLKGSRLDGSLGGNRLLGTIDERRRSFPGDSVPSRTIIVGHSAGGVAAVHAARLLYARDGERPPLVVMIGSPRCRIPGELREHVLYVYAARSESRGARWMAVKLTDPITRLGSFGGWHTDKWRLPRWQTDKHAPIHTSGMRIVGGHADYFREQSPFVNAKGLSNMALTAEVVLKWLKQRL